MSCSKTPHLMKEYFSDDLAPMAEEELEKHLAQCVDCNTELEALLMSQSNLKQWRDQQVPHWDRNVELFKREHRSPPQQIAFWNRLQWLPIAASFAMLAIMIFNVSIASNESGFSISFGRDGESIESMLEIFDQLQQTQRSEMADLVARVEARLDSNNLQLLQAVVNQTQLATAESMDRVYAYFEQQRLIDLQDMRLGYQQLVDSDYETIRSLEQLAQFVSYESEER